MAVKKLLTLKDLHDYYSSTKKNQHFSAQDENSRLYVHVDGKIKFSDYDPKQGLIPVNLWACHDEDNLNGSQIFKEDLEKALPSFANRPILAYIYKDDNGEYQFRDHTMHLDENGEIVYDEWPVGVVPESGNPHLEKGDNGKDYVVVDGYLYEEYNKAKDILERDGDCDVSVELAIDELEYDSESDLLTLKVFYFYGVTILGVFEDGSKVYPAMPGSHISLSDFNQENNSVFQKTVIQKLEELENKVQALSINSKEGGNTTMKFSDEKLKELLEKYSVSESDLTFKLEDIESDEALESAFEAQFSNPSEDGNPGQGSSEKTIEMSVKIGEVTKQFAKSLTDEIYALTDLVNATYEADGTWYYCDVYDGGTAKTRYVIMIDMWGTKAYKQSFTVKDGVYSLKGEREEVFSEWLTQSERDQLENIRNNYSVLENSLAEANKELELYKAEPDKVKLLNAKEYSKVADTDEFKELMNRDTYFTMSLEEVREKADAILLAAAKAGTVDFSAQPQPDQNPDVSSKRFGFGNSDGKTGRYGGVFSKKEN